MSRSSKRRRKILYRRRLCKLVKLANGRHVFLTKKQHNCLLTFFGSVEPDYRQLAIVEKLMQLLKDQHLSRLNADQLAELQLTASLQLEFPGDSFDNALTNRLVNINEQFLT